MSRAISALTLLLPLALFACADDKDGATKDTVDTGEAVDPDQDGDGFYVDEDCDDTDPATHPGADEICDDTDNNCDGEIDENVQRTYYVDADGDGFGDNDVPVYGCEAPTGSVPVGNDCDDAEPAAFPGGTEVCDGVDNDCDGGTDEDSTALWYADGDGDGYGTPGTGVESCDQPEGYVSDNSDCDDASVDINPAASERCDGSDNDCDGDTDEDDAIDPSTWYQDRDEDGYGDASRSTTACTVPDGYVADATDCDDLEAGTWPGADEVCDAADNDCDGEIDEGAVDGAAWYADADGDGYGDPAIPAADCSAPDGYVADDTDCDDGRADVNPGADEICDGIDDDCDGDTDEDSATDASTWYADSDSDGFGDPGASTRACDSPSGYVADATDCDDGDDTVSPDGIETCDGIDNDCDDTTDEDAAVDAATWYEDRDDDGFGDTDLSTRSCDTPTGYVDDDTDCDDLDPTSYPGGTETCDDADNDCDGRTDETGATGGTIYYPDDDSDTFGDIDSTGIERCSTPTGYVTSKTDCDDADADVYPGADEYCDDVDNDCDGSIDEAGSLGTGTYYPDDDDDGYGDEVGTAVTGCDAPTGYVEDHTDCADDDAGINPGETEYCDGTDNDCTGDESDTVTFTRSTGAISDVSSTWTGGSATSPATITASTAGTFTVCPGTYYVSVTASASSLTIEGPYGADETFLSGGGTSRTFNTSKPVTMSGVTLQEGDAGTGYGGNLYTSSTLSLTDVVLDGGVAVRGGNLYCSSCTLTLDGVTISSGEADYGGGLYAATGAITATDLAMTDNDSDYGGAVYGNKLTGTLTSSTISGGYATQYGGGLYLVNSSSIALSGSEITENASSNGAGAYVSAATLSMSSASNIDGNTASLLGGGVYLASTASFTCTGSSSTTAGVWGNTATAAGGVYSASTSATITSTTCDWTATSDNSLYDIVMFLYYYNYGNNASFTCSGYTCS